MFLFGRVGVRGFQFLQFFDLKTYDFKHIQKKSVKRMHQISTTGFSRQQIVKEFLQIFTFMYDL
jgi:hypothetical protein